MVDYSKWWINRNNGLIKMVDYLRWWINQNGAEYRYGGLIKLAD